MEVQDISNYGKGLVDISLDSNFRKSKKDITALSIKALYREIGIFGLINLLWKSNREKKNLERNNWLGIEKYGFKKENIGIVAEDVILMKVLADKFGTDKACSLFSEVLNNVNDKLASRTTSKNILMMPTSEMKLCDDKFIAFKEFLLASEFAMEKEGFHKIEIERNTEKSLKFRVKYCVVNEVAKELGNSIFGFPWCHIDDIALPMIGDHLGFKYFRSGTLCYGEPVCDFYFESN